jgi:hypothetical protein
MVIFAPIQTRMLNTSFLNFMQMLVYNFLSGERVTPLPIYFPGLDANNVESFCILAFYQYMLAALHLFFMLHLIQQF